MLMLFLERTRGRPTWPLRSTWCQRAPCWWPLGWLLGQFYCIPVLPILSGVTDGGQKGESTPWQVKRETGHHLVYIAELPYITTSLQEKVIAFSEVNFTVFCELLGEVYYKPVARKFLTFAKYLTYYCFSAFCFSE